MKLTIVSPERKVVENFEASEVTLTGTEGQFQVLPGHAAFVGALEMGLIRYKSSASTEEDGVISTGFFEIENDVVTVMAETFEFTREIDVERARRAQQKAENALQDASLDEAAFKKYQLKLQRALVRLQFSASGPAGHA